MAELSNIELPSGSVYTFADSSARKEIETIKERQSSVMSYAGITTTALSDGATTKPIKIQKADGTEVEYTQANGDVVEYGKLEFIWSDKNGYWSEFGSTGSLKALAFKSSASGSYTPAGTVSSTLTGTQTTIKSTYTPMGTVSGTSTAKGTNAASSVSITPKTTSLYQMSSDGSVTSGSSASCTFPKLNVTVEGETLKLGWVDGSFTTNTPTKVTLPSRAQVTGLWNGYSAATAAAQTFTGAETAISASFSGTAGEASATYTPAGKVSSSFSGSAKTVEVS